ncbi:MAG: hypothetical protein AAFX96_10030, partial [Pseudomonadota bacterium]
FAMRLGNQKDQEIIRGAVSNGAKSTISFLSSIANRECIAFGEAIPTPMRMTFETMRAEDLPGAHIYEQQEKVKQGLDISMAAVLRRMRQEDTKTSLQSDDPYANSDVGLDAPPISPDQATPAAGPQRELTSSGGDEINSVLSAAYSGPNGSLKPTGNGQAAMSKEPAAKSAAPSTAAKSKPAGGSSILKSFRG